MTYLTYAISLALVGIIGAIAGALYVMARMGQRVMRHQYVCSRCGDEFKLWDLDKEKPHGETPV